MIESKKKILIVEDDEHVSKVYEAKFAKENIATVVVGNGEEGFQKILSEKPELVILDPMLPKKDGFRVLEDVQKNTSLADIPIFVISNLGEDFDQERAFALGAKEYFIKVNHPIQEIVDKAKSFLGKQA